MAKTDSVADSATALDSIILPSRRRLIEACQAAWENGPVVVAGEAGIGKSWLLDRLQAADPRLWVRLDLAPGMDPAELLATIGQRLGMGPAASPRNELAELLVELAATGREAVLAVDEAHLASDAVLEEIRLLSNRLKRPDGFAALLIAGQMELIRRLRMRPLASLRARLAAQLVVPAIGLDEAIALLNAAGTPAAAEWADRWQRDSLGNPGTLLQLGSRAASLRQAVLTAARAASPAAEPPLTRPAPMPTSLLPARPPEVLDEATIEVGYGDDELPDEADIEEPFIAAEPPIDDDIPAVIEQVESSQVIDDHYAALQAWSEWKENQARCAGAAGAASPAHPAEAAAGEGEAADPSNLRAEPEHGFAPYGRLFSRGVAAPDPQF